MKNRVITVKRVEVAIASRHEQGYIALTAFKPLELDRFKSQAGLNSFALWPKKWIDAIGVSDSGARAERCGVEEGR